MKVGSKIKTLRLEQKLSLTDLSQKSGVQIATLSRIENAQMTGTLESHIKIAQALGVDVLALYENIIPKNTPIDFSNPTEQGAIPINSNCSYEILAQQPSTKKMLPRLFKIDAQSSTNSFCLPAGSESFIFMLEGSIDIQFNEQKISIPKNSTFYFNSAQSHCFINDLNISAKFLLISTPVYI